MKALNKKLRKGIHKKSKGLPSIEDLKRGAIKGQAKRGWYARALKRIRKEHGVDTEKFIAILSATSPQQTVELNLRMSRQIWALWNFLDRGTDNYTLEQVADLADLACRKGNVRRALLGEPLSGQKVEAFRRNLLGDGQAVTLDTWMLTFAGLHNDRLLGTKGGYLAYSRRIRRVAIALNWEPREVQESIWSFAYAKINKLDISEVPEYTI